MLCENVLKPMVSVAEIAKHHNVSEAEVKRALAVGTKVEREHTNDETTAKTIASQHLLETIDYYDKLKRVEG